MQAVHVTQHGDPSVLEVVDVARPVPQAGQVLVRILGVSVNHLDLWVRRGMPGFKVPFPRIPGCDGCGEIVELGEGVRAFEVGQRVVIEPGYTDDWESAEVARGADHLAADYQVRGEHGDGLDCEYVAIAARFVFALPAGIDPVQAAAVPLVFLTAWGALRFRAELASGEEVLILGGASGVGSAAIQVAKRRGARVIATAGSAAKRELAVQLGADHVVDHGQPDWGKEVKRLSAGRGVDVVFEHVGPATWRQSMGCLARNGRLVTCGGTTGPKVELLLPHLFIKNLSVLGTTMGPRSCLPEIFKEMAEGHYKPVVDRVLPLSAVREAHQLLEDRQVGGKVVLVPGA